MQSCPICRCLVFYAYQKTVGSSEKQIWTDLYFREDWQLLFDLFDSIPIALVLIIVCYIFGLRFGLLLAASELLHLVCDLPLHHDDAHRHFLPLTNWRYESPLSYRDPRHFGLIFIWVELAFAIASCFFVGLRGEQSPIRIFAWCTLAICFLFIGLAILVLIWM